MKNRALFFALSGVLLIVGGFFVARDVSLRHSAWSNATKRLTSESTQPAFTLYGRCFSQGHCRREFGAMLDTQKPFPMHWYMVVMAGIGGFAVLFFFKPKTKLYEGSLATRRDVEPLRQPNWLRNPRVGNAFLLGHHLEVPEQGEARKAVLRGWDLRSLDKQLMVVRPGYGKRNELPLGAVFGTTRSGKTMHLMTQALRWTNSFVALDVKGEIYQKTAGVCANRGQVFVLSPDGKGAQFNPLQELLKSGAGIGTAANIIAAPHLETGNGLYFAEKASQGIAAGFYAARFLKKPPFDFLYDLILEGGMGSFVARIRSIPDEDVRVALNKFLDPHGGEDFNLQRALEESSLTNSWSTMIKSLSPFMGKEVRWLMRRSDFTPRDLLTRSTYVYLQFPETTLEATSKVYDLIVTGLTRAMFDYVGDTLKFKSPKSRVLLLLDELYAAPISNLGKLYATAAGRHITPILYCQSPSQLEELYGPKGANAILDNCGVQLFYKSETPATAKRISEIAGKVSRREQRSSHRWKPLGFKTPTISEGNQSREVISPDEVDLVGGKDREVILAKVSGLPLMLMRRLNPYTTPRLTALMKSYPAPELKAAPLEDLLQRTPLVLTDSKSDVSARNFEQGAKSAPDPVPESFPPEKVEDVAPQSEIDVSAVGDLPVVKADHSPTAQALRQLTQSANDLRKANDETEQDDHDDDPTSHANPREKGKPSVNVPLFE